MKVKIPMCLVIYPEVELDSEGIETFGDSIEGIGRHAKEVPSKPDGDLLGALINNEEYRAAVAKVMALVYQLRKDEVIGAELSTFVGVTPFKEI
jgi:hypothetical protein